MSWSLVCMRNTVSYEDWKLVFLNVCDGFGLCSTASVGRSSVVSPLKRHVRAIDHDEKARERRKESKLILNRRNRCLN